MVLSCDTALIHLKNFENWMPGCIAQSVARLTQEPEVNTGSILGPATYFGFSFHRFKKGSCQLLAKVCTGSTG